MLLSFLNKVAGLRAFKFIKKRFQHGCFPVKFAKVFRTTISKKNLQMTASVSLCNFICNA